MAGGNAIRGSRVGAGPMGEAERGETAPRVFVTFYCANGHQTRPSFAREAVSYTHLDVYKRQSATRSRLSAGTTTSGVTRTVSSTWSTSSASPSEDAGDQ